MGFLFHNFFLKKCNLSRDANFERVPCTCKYCARCLHKAHGRHAPVQKCLHLSNNKTTQLGAFPLNLFLFCALLTSTTCLHMHYTGTKHVYNAAKGHVAYIAHRRVLCTALRHIMSTSMPLCKGPFIIPVPKKTCSIPMSTSDFSYLYR
jgi:hypothetical protein